MIRTAGLRSGFRKLPSLGPASVCPGSPLATVGRHRLSGQLENLDTNSGTSQKCHWSLGSAPSSLQGAGWRYVTFYDPRTGIVTD